MTIVAWSMGMTYALKAADELAKDGIEAEVIDLRTLKPMDTDTIIESVRKPAAASRSRRAGSNPASARRSPPASWSTPSTISMRRSRA